MTMKIKIPLIAKKIVKERVKEIMETEGNPEQGLKTKNEILIIERKNAKQIEVNKGAKVEIKERIKKKMKIRHRFQEFYLLLLLPLLLPLVLKILCKLNRELRKKRNTEIPD